MKTGHFNLLTTSTRAARCSKNYEPEYPAETYADFCFACCAE